MPIVAELIRRGYNYRDIQKEVKARLGFATYSLDTIHHDVQTILTDWRKERDQDIDGYIQLELQRNLEQMREAWSAWVKSKLDYKIRSKTTTAIPRVQVEAETAPAAGRITSVIHNERDEITCGNPDFLAEMRMLGDQRSKLLGLFAAQKVEATGKGGADLFEKMTEEELEKKVEQYLKIHNRK